MEEEGEVLKKPERLQGFLQFEEISYPFDFDEKNFQLTLYPPDFEVWKTNSSLEHFFSDYTKRMELNDWLPYISLKGTTSDGYNILFRVQDSPINHKGFIFLHTNWYFLYTDNLYLDSIDGFRVIGHDVDLFYPLGIDLEANLEYREEELTGFSISTKNVINTEQCGKYRICKYTDAIMELSTMRTLNINPYKPTIDSKSSFTTEFSKPVDFEILVKAYFNLLSFFRYITYRMNIKLGDIEVLKKDEKGKLMPDGLLIFPKQYNEETNQKSKERVITYPFLKNKTGKLFTAIKNKNIGLQHLCKSLEDQQHDTPDRIIMILAEFENEFKHFYGKDCGRSDEYIEVKKDVIAIMDKYKKSLYGKKKKKYVNGLKTLLEKKDNSFEKKTEIALKDNENVMFNFVKLNEKKYEERIKEISVSLGGIRNDIAHGRIGISYSFDQLTDIWLMERLLYCMCLKKKLHLDDKTCIESIKKIF